MRETERDRERERERERETERERERDRERNLSSRLNGWHYYLLFCSSPPCVKFSVVPRQKKEANNLRRGFSAAKPAVLGPLEN